MERIFLDLIPEERKMLHIYLATCSTKVAPGAILIFTNFLIVTTVCF
jgi:hypothetical protein